MAFLTTRLLRYSMLGFCLLNSACFGTVLTRAPDWRVDPEAETFGWPLFGAVHADWCLIADGFSPHQGIWWFSAAFGWPVDLVVDLVLVPLDLLGGVLGQDKTSYSDYLGSE